MAGPVTIVDEWIANNQIHIIAKRENDLPEPLTSAVIAHIDGDEIERENFNIFQDEICYFCQFMPDPGTPFEARLFICGKAIARSLIQKRVVGFIICARKRFFVLFGSFYFLLFLLFYFFYQQNY